VSAFRIVLVEDNAADVLLIKEALQHHGLAYTLEHYANGEDAAKAIAAAVEPPDLFLLDLNVPRLHGLELLRLIREAPLMAHVPVAIVTSSHAAGDRAESEQLGADAYIVKPTGYADYKTRVGQTIVELLQRKPRAAIGARRHSPRAPRESHSKTTRTAHTGARQSMTEPRPRGSGKALLKGGKSRSGYRSPRFSLRES
jgi:CheY-like chemotaxis protein